MSYESGDQSEFMNSSIENIIYQFTAQKMKFSSRDLFCKCEQICRKLQIWLYLQNKSLMENFIFCAVIVAIIIFDARCCCKKNFLKNGF